MMPSPQFGTPKQAGYLKALFERAGYPTIEAGLVGIGRAGDAQDGLDVTRASALITELESQQRPALDAPPSGLAEVARYLRAAAGARASLPESVLSDRDARWVLDRLSHEERHETQNVNRGGPIQMQALSEYFGSWEALAAAFGVTVHTAKAWGSNLPQARAYEAQVKTRGHFHAPRSGA